MAYREVHFLVQIPWVPRVVEQRFGQSPASEQGVTGAAVRRCSQRSDSDPITVDGQRLCPLNSSAKMSSRAGRCSVDDAAPWRPGGPPAST